MTGNNREALSSEQWEERVTNMAAFLGAVRYDLMELLEASKEVVSQEDTITTAYVSNAAKDLESALATIDEGIANFTRKRETGALATQRAILNAEAYWGYTSSCIDRP
jgi:hypothetical protein